MQVEVTLMAERLATAYEHKGWVYGALKHTPPLTVGPLSRKILDLWRAALARTAPLHIVLKESSDYRPVVPDEALMDFMNMRLRNANDALGFLKRYGLFDAANLNKPMPTVGNTPSRALNPYAPPRVHQHWEECERRRERPFALRLHDLWEEQRILSALWDLGKAIPVQDYNAIEHACARVCYLPVDRKADWLETGTMLFLSQIAIGLQEAWLIVANRSGKMVPVATTSAVRPALYLALVSMISKETPAATCEQCRGWFVVTRPTKRFCSEKCQALAKVNRFRSKVKASRKHTKQKRVTNAEG